MLLGIDASRAMKKEKTGVEWYSWHLLHAMEQNTPPNWRIDLYIYTNYELGELQIMNDDWKLKALNWPLKYLWTQARLSYEMKRRPPDVLFVPGHVLPIIHPSRSIVTIHDVGFKRFPECYSYPARAYLDWSTRQAAMEAKKIIVPSEFTKKELQNFYGVWDNQVAVVPHGVDFDFWQKNSEAADAKKIKQKYHFDKPYVIFVGRLEEKKNISRLLAAWQAADIKDFDLVLVGNSQTILPSENVKILGWLRKDDLRELYWSAAAMIMPSLYEGFGLTLLEAMAAGAPVAASDIAAHREVAGEAAIFFDPLSVESIVESLKRICGDGALRGTLKEKGKQKASEFSWQKSAERTWGAIVNVE
ncbi:MAG: glycosyltransferase family 1 protein [Thermodesulfovibrionia bacterium]|nr:glycosyltransferase family 1 protein [Thermodesulfovibrionia bacterium]